MTLTQPRRALQPFRCGSARSRRWRTAVRSGRRRGRGGPRNASGVMSIPVSAFRLTGARRRLHLRRRRAQRRGSRRCRWPDARHRPPVARASSRMPAILPPFRSTSLGHLSAMSGCHAPTAMNASRSASAATKDRAPRRRARPRAASGASRRSCPPAWPRRRPRDGRGLRSARAPASIPVPAHRPRPGARPRPWCCRSGSGCGGPRPRARPSPISAQQDLGGGGSGRFDPEKVHDPQHHDRRRGHQPRIGQDRH
jgi:hypothetical protein